MSSTEKSEEKLQRRYEDKKRERIENNEDKTFERGKKGYHELASTMNIDEKLGTHVFPL